jgi:phospholipid-translocating ATPase
MGQLVTKTSGDLRIGEIVLVRETETCPADLLILHTDQEDGKCQIKTDQIDGETDTKIRKAVSYSQKIIDAKENFLDKQFEIIVDTPNDLIYKFQGALHEVDISEKKIIHKHSIGVENSVWA